MLNIETIDLKIKEKKAGLAECVARYNDGQALVNQLSIEIIKLQGSIDLLEELKKELNVKTK